MVRVVLDANIILYFLGGRLAEPLLAGPYTISVISELDLLACVPSEEQRVRARLADIVVMELTQAIKSHAVDFRKRYGLKLPDAIVAATALALYATLLTNDQRLLALTEAPTQMLLSKSLS